MRPKPDPVGPGQEFVGSFPRPAIAQTSHPPSRYILRQNTDPDVLPRAAGSSFCEWKGDAGYWDVVTGDLVLAQVGWSQPTLTPRFAALRDHVACYAAPLDHCSVDGETMTPQPGAFYGGWIASAFAGPFEGIPGSQGW